MTASDCAHDQCIVAGSLPGVLLQIQSPGPNSYQVGEG